MSDLVGLSGTQLGVKEQKAVMAFCEALRDAPNVNVQSITLYGSAARKDYRPRKSDINLLVVVERINVAILQSVLGLVSRGRRHRIAPLFMTEENLRSSADVFPVKFLAMRESYKLLVGRDVLSDLKIKREYIRLRCEQEIKNLLLRLRHHYIMGRGRRLTEMMSRMIVGFLENLRVVLSLDQETLPPREDVVNAAAKTFEFDAEVLRNVRGLRHRSVSLSRKETRQLYDKFMGTVERVAQILDQMK